MGGRTKTVKGAAALATGAVVLTAALAACLALHPAGALGQPEPLDPNVPADPNAPIDPTSPADPNSPSDPTTTAAPLPKAKSVDLHEPVAESAEKEPDTDPGIADPPPEEVLAPDTPPLVMLGTEVPPLTSTRLSWSPDHSFEGLASPTPVLVVHGAEPGPTLCLTAAIHGDELNGIEIVRRVLYNIEANELSGSVIGVPIVNLQGFHRRSRYLSDRRDLNRYFPGTPDGSSAARIAYSFFNEVISHCSALVDIHTGSFDRTNLPQLRADLSYPEVVALTEGFGATVVLHNDGAIGTLRRASVEHGIPAVTLEVGGPMRLQQDSVKHAVKSIHTLLDHLDMIESSRIWGAPEPVYYQSQWLRADIGGILLSKVELGEEVEQGDTLGFITNPITNVRSTVTAPIDGRILGMALDQVVLPGYAAYHIGISAKADEIPAQPDYESEIASLEGGENGTGEADAGVAEPEPEDAEAESRPVDDILQSD